MDSYRAIQNLLSTYAERIDAGDFAGVGQLFARGEILAPAGDQGVKGAANVQAMYELFTKVYADGTPCTQHQMSNVWIEVDEAAGKAQARSRFTVLQQLEDFPLQVIIAGGYEDSFERDAQGWHFVRRLMKPRLYGDLSRHLLQEVPR